jgi:hypothetical protein
VRRKAKKSNQGGGAGGIPARHVARQPFSNTGFNTLHHVPVDYEATQESRFVTWARFQPNFVEIISQPYKIPYITPDGCKGAWYPDYLVRWKVPQKPWIVEIKNKRRMQARQDRRVIAAKMRGGRAFARARGMWMRLLTEKTTQSQRAANAVFLLPFRKWSPAPELHRDLIAAALDPINSTVLDVIDRVASHQSREDVIAAFWHLVATFTVLIDYDAPILMSSRIRGAAR